MSIADFVTLVKILCDNGIQFELNNIANPDGDITPTILIYEQEIEMDKG